MTLQMHMVTTVILPEPTPDTDAEPTGGIGWKTTMRMAMKGKAMRQPPTFDELHTARPYSEWHEDMGAVLWHHMPIESPPWCGTPNDSDWYFGDGDEEYLWWSPLPDGNLIQDRWTIAQKGPIG